MAAPTIQMIISLFMDLGHINFLRYLLLFRTRWDDVGLSFLRQKIEILFLKQIVEERILFECHNMRR